MMFVSQEKLAFILLYSLFIGVFLAIVYDVFRIRRLAYRTRASFSDKSKKITSRKENMIESTLIFFEDVLFALIASVVVCIFIFYMNRGQFRGIALVGTFLGFLAYYFTVGRLVMYFSGVIIGFLKFLTRKIYEYTLHPLKKSVIFIIRHTFVCWYWMLMTLIYRNKSIKDASAGFSILDTIKKERWNNEKSFKHIRKDRSTGVRDILLGDDNKNAV